MENYLKKELYELIKKEDYIFEFLQTSSLDGLWYWDLENMENEWMNERFWTAQGLSNPRECINIGTLILSMLISGVLFYISLVF